MKLYPESLSDLIQDLNNLPGVGKRTAMRYAFWLVNQDQEFLNNLSHKIEHIKSLVSMCQECFNNAEQTLCPICADPKRDKQIMCIVETAEDIVQLERIGYFKGIYHVLGGVINPLKGVNPDDLHISTISYRIQKHATQELILGTNPTIQGDTTAVFIKNMLKGVDIKITTLARGLATGSSLEYTDETTLKNALENRK